MVATEKSQLPPRLESLPRAEPCGKNQVPRRLRLRSVLGKACGSGPESPRATHGGAAGEAPLPCVSGGSGNGSHALYFFPFPPDISAFPQAAPFTDGADSSR